MVVEANSRGGALITASTALDQGVSVFAVPGDVGRESSRGCNLLIRDGAHPVLDPADLIAELELVLGPVPDTRKHGGSEMISPDSIPGEGVSLDALATQLELSAAEVLGTVAVWEANGRVERVGDLVYPKPDR